MSEWSDLTEEEQRFAQAHLLYLNLQGQAATVAGLRQVRDVLEEIAEAFAAAIEWIDRPEEAVNEEAPVEPEVVEQVEEMLPAA